MHGARRAPIAQPPAAPAVPAPELVKSDKLIADPFIDTPAYEAVRALHTRSLDAFFYLGAAEFFARPYAYFQGMASLPDGGLVLHWPGSRIEVRGDHLGQLMSRIALRRADVWRVFRPDYHAAPETGAAVIRSIALVLEGDGEAR